MSGKPKAFKPYHMDELSKLGMGGSPCATLAAREIQQLNAYAYALESALVFGFDNKEEVRQMIAVMREMFAPDVDFIDVPRGDAE